MQTKKLTKAQLAQLDDICIEAYRMLDEMDERMYHLGWLKDERKKPAWRSPFAPGAGKRYGGEPNSTVLKPTPLPLLPAGGAKVGVK